MPPAPVVVDRPRPHVLRLLIHRPDKRNAIDFDVRQALFEALSDPAQMSGVRAVVFGGTDGVLSAGGDIASMVDLSEDAARARMQHGHRLCRAVADLSIPVVTAIEGFGVGAAVGLALLGDWIVVNRHSKILFPFLKLGLAPDWGLLYTLPRRLGPAAARRVLLEGRMIEGEEAVRFGLADQLVEDGEVQAAAIARAEQLAALPLDAFARMKARLNVPSATLDYELTREENDQVALLRGPDFVEGFAAFQEKRAPRFVRP